MHESSLRQRNDCGKIPVPSNQNSATFCWQWWSVQDSADNGDAGQRLTCRQPSCLDPFTLWTRGFLSCFFLFRPRTSFFANTFFERFLDDSFFKKWEFTQDANDEKVGVIYFAERGRGCSGGGGVWGSCVFFTSARSKWRPASLR